MTDRPIIFSAPMIRALLDGRKTQTRRVLKPRPEYCGPGKSRDPQNWSDPEAWGWEDYDAGCWRTLDERDTLIRPTFYRRDRLWVRETWNQSGLGWGNPRAGLGRLHYRADPDHGWQDYWGGWRSPIHMPRWASRLTLTVTDVRVQRLQKISASDVAAEGACELAFVPATDEDTQEAREVFRALWNSIHGHDAWDANPWVVALTFTVWRGNIDA